jgi:hypothetical protein
MQVVPEARLINVDGKWKCAPLEEHFCVCTLLRTSYEIIFFELQLPFQ